MGKQQIARRLNSDKVLNGNRLWKESSINVILNNEKYTGNMLLQKKYIEDFRTKKQKVNHGERRQYFVEDSHEAIIPPEMFELVMTEQLKRNKRGYGLIRGEGHIFSGMIQCGICKSPYVFKMAPTTANGQRAWMPVWMCHGYEKIGKDYCSSQRIREDVLIEKTREVLGLSEETVLTQGLLQQEIEKIEIPAHNTIRYYLHNGRIETVEWKNPSRSLSWTPEMRRKVGEKNRSRSKEPSLNYLHFLNPRMMYA